METWVAKFVESIDSLPDSSLSWLNEARKKGIDQFSNKGFPTTRDEAWKYTNVALLKKRNFNLLSSKKTTLTKDDLDSFRFADLETVELVFINGHFSAELSSKIDQVQGVILQNLSAWLAEEQSLDLSVNADENVFASLNNAFMSDGMVLHIDKNTVLNKPVHLIFVATETDEPIMIYPRIDIRLAANSQARVIESYVSIGQEDKLAKNLTNTLTNIVTGEMSHLEHYRIQDESTDAYHIANVLIDQKHDSQAISHSVSLGASLARVDIKVSLGSEGAENTLNGLFMGKGLQHTDHHILVDHLSPYTRSEEFFKGIMDDRSRGVFNGKVIVHEHAQKIDAVQSNKNLLLSSNAEIDTKPELEIYADDVKCSHGATIGRLSDTELFYLQSRGIGEEKARALLTYAFADEVISRMSLAPVREYLEQKIVGQLSSLENIRDLV